MDKINWEHVRKLIIRPSTNGFIADVEYTAHSVLGAHELAFPTLVDLAEFLGFEYRGDKPPFKQPETEGLTDIEERGMGKPKAVEFDLYAGQYEGSQTPTGTIYEHDRTK